MFLPKTSLVSETDLCQILRLKYYTKLKEWWTDDVLLVLTRIEKEKVQFFLLKRWRGVFRKEENCQIYRHCFYLEELIQVDETKIEDKEDHFDYSLNLIQIQNLDLFRISFNRLSNLKRIPVVYITIYHKESDKKFIFW